MIIDMGLSKEYYKYEPDSLNVHEHKSPTIVDDLISLCYTLVVIFTGKNLPWVGHQKDADKFDINSHTVLNCKCGYHKNIKNNDTKKNNTIAEIKFHTPLDILVEKKYNFLIKWLKYLYSLKPKQLPSYNYLYKCLAYESKQYDTLYFKLENK